VNDGNEIWDGSKIRVVEGEQGYEFKETVLSGWSVEFVPGSFIHPLNGKEPNWFWRTMQYLILGFKWRKG